MQTVNVIGAGLAGSEAAYQLATRGFHVRLFEMRPSESTPTHHTDKFAELVCSNSLRSADPAQAVGALKEEMRLMNSLIIQAADHTRVPAGGALAVDRDAFSAFITDILKKNTNITIHHERVDDVPEGPTIIATGPLTDSRLANALAETLGTEKLYFFDAAAPIIDADSINMDICYKKSRYDKGGADYINCAMSQEEYDRFYHELINAECTELKDFELKLFEACMPVEEMARRGKDTLLFGPLKPVGLGLEGREKPHAVVQLRQDDVRATMYNMVGFQTHLKHGEQKRVFRLIPGLENARFLRNGVMHRNTYIHAPSVLEASFRVKGDKSLYLAGQLTGVEGYVESAASGALAGWNLARELEGKAPVILPKETILGALADYVANAQGDFQPMHVNYGLVPELGVKHKKKERKQLYAQRAIKAMKEVIARER